MPTYEMRALYIILLILMLATAVVQAVIIDDFSGDLSNWTNTVILDTDIGGGANTSTWQITDGKLEIVTTLYQSIEQHALIYADLSLAVGQEVRVDLVHNGGSQDLGLYVGGTTPVAGVRQDYISVYARNNGQVLSRGFDGTSEYGLVGGSSPTYEKLFIARTADNTFEVGYYEAGVRSIFVTRTPSTPNAATVIGIYADVRNTGVLGNLDNLEIISIPAPPTVVNDPNDLTISQSQNASFETIFTSASAPSTSWYKVALPDDVLIDPNQFNIDVQLIYDAQTEQYTSTLTIGDLTIADSGQYYCRISNDSGTLDTNTANLSVYGLVAHWTLDQDRSGYVDPNYYYLEEIAGYDAAVNGIPTFVTGADGIASHAAQITSGEGSALCPILDPIKQSGRMTISFWANWNETPGTQEDLLAESSQTSLVDPNGLKADGNWQHICTVYDGTTGKLYVDGVLQNQVAWQLPSDTEAAISIGITNDGQTPFNGAIDDVRFFNYALTDFEVADLRYTLSGDRSCILAFNAIYDLSGPNNQPDCIIDMYDLVAFASQWVTLYDLVNFTDLASIWQSSGLYPPNI